MKILKTWAHGIRIYPNWLLIRTAFTNFRNDHKMSKKRICRYKFFEGFSKMVGKKRKGEWHWKRMSIDQRPKYESCQPSMVELSLPK